MARSLRIEFRGALYHVTFGGDAQQDIFHDDEDRNFGTSANSGDSTCATLRGTTEANEALWRRGPIR